MLVSTILSVFAALSFGITSAAPVAVERAELSARASGIPSILATLSGKVATYKTQIDAAVATKDTSALAKHITSLKTAFDSATSDAKALDPSTALGGSNAHAVAATYARIIRTLAPSLGRAQELISTSGDLRRQLDLSSLFASLIGSLNGLSAALNNLVDGLLDLVGRLLIAVAALLTRLGIALINF